jgi:hypothetical protein
VIVKGVLQFFLFDKCFYEDKFLIGRFLKEVCTKKYKKCFIIVFRIMFYLKDNQVHIKNKSKKLKFCFHSNLS